jgi:AcrR family transcriptional regulator
MDSQRGEARIIDAAETLFAERGLDGVTTREILDAAGQKNQSALQYHFGSREGLILALLADRFARIDKRRMELFSATKRPGKLDLRAYVEALVLPLAEEVRTRQGGDAFIRVLAQLVHRPGFDALAITRAAKFEGLRLINTEAEAQLVHLPKSERPLRTRMMLSLMVGTISAWSLYHKRTVPFDVMLNGLIAALMALASAPPSPRTSPNTQRR